MDIIIDTNILRKDIKLKSKDFEILIDYVTKTGSKIILSTLVIKEISNLYRNILIEKITEIETRIKKLESTLVETKIEPIADIDVEKEVENYIIFLKHKLKIQEDNILEFQNSFLPELVDRAILKKKPLGADGQQFRDGILWLSTLDYAKETDEKKVILISDNASDFCGTDKFSLDKDLIEEAKSEEVEILFYRNISNFSEQHSSIIEFINDDWINENVNINILQSLFWDGLSTFEEGIVETVSLDYNEKATGYIDRSEFIEFSKDKYFVYEKEDRTILLNIKFTVLQEFLVEIEREIENDYSEYEHSYTYNPSTEDFEFDSQFVPRLSYELESDFKGQEELFEVDYVLTLKDQKIINYDLKSFKLK